MYKRLVLQERKCVNCKICEFVCSMHHRGEFSPVGALVRVRKLAREFKNVIQVCTQCRKKLCQDVCLRKALSTDQVTGATIVDTTKCDGCEKCILACPNQAIKLVSVNGPVEICDLCGGDPECVKYCPTGAIKFSTLQKARETIVKEYMSTTML